MTVNLSGPAVLFSLEEAGRVTVWNINAAYAAEREANMADLKCAVENCTYNDRCLCCKGDIMVGGKHAEDCDGTCCESFFPQREGVDSFKSSVVHPSQTISIDCEAVKCIYNTNYKCHADHVDIKGSGADDFEQTACATFTEK